MPVEAWAALAAVGGTGVAEAVGTGAWPEVRRRAARLLARGDERREHDELARLDRAAAEFAAAERGDEAERVRFGLRAVWRTRFETLLEDLSGEQERAEVAALLRDLAPDTGDPPGSGPGIRADRGSIAAGVVNGGAYLGPPLKPVPSRG
ncbi:hypothetical protein [Streptomyces sp. NBC_01803]|uniref:hypothetical protein n=1 Tax=Streptomyces sp. NBC_01803 TaxID=2975946 RepID=UPI002DDA49EE|nr:hypothetical protein [Streptomyces sp. NBC_01803]WSA45429.1 hypothetical protein OIE51_15180 [Streptomyces sp. NBC_01803]